MPTKNNFETVIKNYLDNRAREDSLFAETYKKPGKNLKECCRYIISRAPARRKPADARQTNMFNQENE